MKIRGTMRKRFPLTPSSPMGMLVTEEQAVQAVLLSLDQKIFESRVLRSRLTRSHKTYMVIDELAADGPTQARRDQQRRRALAEQVTLINAMLAAHRRHVHSAFNKSPDPATLQRYHLDTYKWLDNDWSWWTSDMRSLPLPLMWTHYRYTAVVAALMVIKDPAAREAAERLGGPSAARG